MPRTNYAARNGRFFAEFKPEFSAYENARHEARFALFHIRFVQAVGERNRKRVHCKPQPEQRALREKRNVVFHLSVLCGPKRKSPAESRLKYFNIIRSLCQSFN